MDVVTGLAGLGRRAKGHASNRILGLQTENAAFTVSNGRLSHSARNAINRQSWLEYRTAYTVASVPCCRLAFGPGNPLYGTDIIQPPRINHKLVFLEVYAALARGGNNCVCSNQRLNQDSTIRWQAIQPMSKHSRHANVRRP